MSVLPVYVSTENDYLVWLVAVPADSKVSDIITAAAGLSIDVHVPAQPDATLCLRKLKEDKPLPPDAPAAGLIEPTEWLHLYYDTAIKQ